MTTKNDAQAAPRVSIIIPAYQAAQTLDRALDSLVAQHFGDWEAIVVDDGSSDDTLGLARRRAASDPRIRVFHQNNRGASAARNHGLRERRGAWIGYLDSDDTFHPAFLEKLLALADDNPSADVVHCDFALVDAAGAVQEEQHVESLVEPFAVLARSCVLSVHCALTKTALVERAGWFDETLEVNEDWDVWQRIARTGAVFMGIREVLAYYYTRANSLSRRKLEKLLRDGYIVIDRNCSRDPAVPNADPRYADGLPDEERAPMILSWIVMCGANAIAQDVDPVELIDIGTELRAAPLIPQETADSFVGGLAFGCCVEATELAARWDVLGPRIDTFFGLLGDSLDQPRAADTIRALIRVAIFRDPDWSEYASDHVHATRVDLARPLPAIDPETRDAVLVTVADGPVVLGVVELPAPAPIPPATLATAIASAAPYWRNRKHVFRLMGVTRSPAAWRDVATGFATKGGWGIKARLRSPRRLGVALRQRLRVSLLHAFAGSVVRRLEHTGDSATFEAALSTIARDETARLDDVPAAAAIRRTDAEWREVAVNSPEYWDQVFEQENPWAYDSPYEETKYQQTLSLIPSDKPGTALELACAEGHFSLNLAKRVKHLLATDISQNAIDRARKRCEGENNVDFAQLDFFNKPIPGTYDLIVCSEVLYECGSRPKLESIARNIADHLKPGGALVMAHVIEASEERDRSAFDWDGVFGAKSIAEVFLAIPGMTLEKQLEGELYRIHRFRRSDVAIETETVHVAMGAAPEAEYAAYVAWGGSPVLRSEVADDRAIAIPVLMYHRIAEQDNGPGALAQYRVPPDRFDAQMRWLRQHGYSTIGMDALADALREGRPLPGRPVVLTFDDGYADFADAAWPILKHYGMTATVGIVTDKVGGRADWDEAFGAPAPLMDWASIQRVAGEGAEIASHSAGHPAFPAIGATHILREALRSRAAIERAVGIAPAAMIYPYGAYDALSARACAMAGYGVGLGTEDRFATLLDDPLHLPRLTVDGLESMDQFIDRLTRIDMETGDPRKLRQAA